MKTNEILKKININLNNLSERELNISDWVNDIAPRLAPDQISASWISGFEDRYSKNELKIMSLIWDYYRNLS